ncbi:hypothetical protein [Erythrobacter neustonensis]|uniref:Uncharacterized protein n=1 Tax=Erythrobacter neustonensis TaxID=1112 RepID=A0A192D139_9SPHN|nr:hypothetical protein [Erythrobacter neustonensis]ANK12223.1 hypothetical protein A9D12_03885 [Erythrobacter neustonensis]
MSARDYDQAPEDHDSEQDPVGTQAQDVADEARREDSRTSSPLESTKPDAGGYDVAPDSTPDLVDEMRRMEGDGTIDMSAFAGEPNHDDEEGTYGTDTADTSRDDWVTADGAEMVEQADLLDDAGLMEEAEMNDEDDIVRSALPDDEED